MNKGAALKFLAGPGAYREIREHGFSPARVGTIAGASGGAKWLVLSHLDRVISAELLPELQGPVHLVGSSIGAWRMACYAQQDPRQAIESFEHIYLEQRYSERPDTAEITESMRSGLSALLGADGAAAVVRHPHFRTHVLTVRSRLPMATDYKPVLGAGLLAAAFANTLSRRALGAFFRRGLFYDSRDLPPFIDVRDFPTDKIELTEKNVADAIIASSAIPMVLSGVRDIEGAPAGTYRDGGIIDYHLDLPLSSNGRLTLYPHFTDRIVPGWFDKRLPRRAPAPEHVDRVVLICPSESFVARLPGGKIPDRTDFQTMPQEQRIANWKVAVAACRELADELNDTLQNERLAAVLQPL